MQIEGCFKKDGKVKIGLCSKKKKNLCPLCYEAVAVVKKYYVRFLKLNPEPNKLSIKTTNCAKIQRQTTIAAGCV